MATQVDEQRERERTHAAGLTRVDPAWDTLVLILYIFTAFHDRERSTRTSWRESILPLEERFVMVGPFSHSIARQALRTRGAAKS